MHQRQNIQATNTQGKELAILLFGRGHGDLNIWLTGEHWASCLALQG